MASYKSGFDPPTRPQENSRARRLGTYMQQNAGQRDETESRRIGTGGGRSGQTTNTLPRPRMRDPSPNMGPRLEGSRMTSKTDFVYGSRGTSKTTITAGPPKPELRGKGSRNVLRRKPSSVAQDVRPEPDSLSSTGMSSERRSESKQRSAQGNEIFTRPPRTRTPAAMKEEQKIYPELDRYRRRDNSPLPPKLSTQDLPPAPTPLLSSTPGYSAGSSRRYSGYSGSGYSASPSTRFSESPGMEGMGGAYSRDTTPTSMSSVSPGLTTFIGKAATPRLRQASPALNRPPVVTRRPAGSIEHAESTQGLPSLRESITSSSSNSTVKGDGKAKEKKKKKRLSPMPPSPPPRKSSQKFHKKTRSDEREIEASPSKVSTQPAREVMNVASPERQIAPSPVTSPAPPRRPSRDGTPDLTQLSNAMPIVQSNLTNLPPQSRRQSSLPMPRGTSPQLINRSRIPSRNPSPVPILSPREGTPAPSGLGIIPDLRPQQPSRLVSRTPRPSISSSKPRFGLFTRRTKTVPEPNQPQPTRKGPAAGTGHEGYGKYSAATRGRSSSAGTYASGTQASSSRKNSLSLSIAGSTSQESVSSTRTADPWLGKRMSPVIIAGGGEIRENMNDLMRTESGTSLLLDNPIPKGSHEGSRMTLWPSAMPRDPSNSRRTSLLPSSKSRRPSDASDDGIAKRTLAYRRSQRFDPNSMEKPVLPRPINVRTMSTSTTSLSTSILSDDTTAELGTARKATLTKPKKLEKAPKKPELSRKWNFFRRDTKKDDIEKGKATPEPLSVVVGQVKERQKFVPHYALLDSSDENVDRSGNGEVDLEGLLRDARDAEVAGLSNEELDLLQFGEFKKIPSRQEDVPERETEGGKEEQPRPQTPLVPLLFSSPEPMQQPTMDQPSTSQESSYSSSVAAPQTHPPQPHQASNLDLHLEAKEPARTRPSRLPQVGRIPKVVSARPGTTSPKSFSRPFARLSMHAPPRPVVVGDEGSVAQPKTPSPVKVSSPELVEPVQAQTQLQLPQGLGVHEMVHRLRSSSTSTSTKHSSTDPTKEGRDFLSFSPRKDSATTTTSSSGGQMSFADIVAVVPSPDDPLVEDEMWTEFDDLMPRTPRLNTTFDITAHDKEEKVPVSATSSLGYPFQYESYETRRMRLSKLHPTTQSKESPTLVPGPLVPNPRLSPNLTPVANPETSRRSNATSSSVYSVDMTARLKEDLKGIPSPSTPMSFSDFFEGYGDRNLSGLSMRLSTSQLSPRSQANLQARKGSNASVVSQARSSGRLSKSLGVGLGLTTVAEKKEEGVDGRGHGGVGKGDVELRVGSMTVSRWLTFGQVLFSPGRDEVVGGKVLVVDGLGNDDWSFYAAETYPNATFYNLSSTHPPSTTGTPSLLPQLANHCQVYYPFLSNTPPSTHPTNTSSASQATHSQAPSPLPKFPFPPSTFTQIIYRFPPLSPPSTYTHIISESKRCLKPGGYLELCVLDLDMVCMGPRTRHALRDLKVKVSNGAVAGGPMLGSAGDFLGKELGKRGWEGVRSCSVGVPVFGEVATPASSRSNSESEASGKGKQRQGSSEAKETGKDGDKDITKLVAKVGRWWWSRCYDSRDGLGLGGNGIFGKEVLEECEEWRTSLKLFVGVARKCSLSSGSNSSSGKVVRLPRVETNADVRVGLRGGDGEVIATKDKERSEERDTGNGYRRAVGGRGKGNSF